jgi:hypothetical protein
MKDLGIALFADQKKPKDGFFCRGGEAESIAGLHELSTDCLWVTNIRPYDFMQGGYGQLRHLRSANFFRTDLGFLIREFGLEGDLAEASIYIRRVLVNALQVIQDRQSIDIEDCAIGIRQELTAQLVPESLTTALLSDSVLHEGVRQSIQYNQGHAVSSNIPRGSKIFSFTAPRSALASYLCSLRLPSASEWSPVSFNTGVLRIGKANGRSAQDEGEHSSFDKMLGMANQKQFILDIDIREMDRRYSAYKTFGVGDRTSRRWACVEEIAELKEYAIIDIRGGYACERSKDAPPAPDMPPEFSIGRSIANEIYSLAIASNRSSSSPSPWTAYLRAVERIVLGRAADAFAVKGFCVGSFGTGRINVFLRSSEYKAACELALSLGLMPPYSLLSVPLSATKVVFQPKLYYRKNLLDEAIDITSFVDKLESDWLRMFVTSSGVRGESPASIQQELDALLELPEDRRLNLFERLANEHIEDLPDAIDDSSEKQEGSGPDNLVF